MFCYQCEQTAKGEGGTVWGTCGKNPELSALQDLLIYSLMGLSQVVQKAEGIGIKQKRIGRFMVKAARATLTYGDVDPQRCVEFIQQTVVLRDQIKEKMKRLDPVVRIPQGPADFEPASTHDALIRQGKEVCLLSYPSDNEKILSLKHIVLLGLKGGAAYADHARILGWEDDDIYRYVFNALAAIQRVDLELGDWMSLVLECGNAALRAMRLLDEAITETYGHPVPTRVPRGYKKGSAILVSGHDLKALEEVLRQTRYTGIHIYTHGEMLGTHGYPELKKYDHLYGHYGAAPENRAREFADFPGPVLLTTSGPVLPRNSCEDTLYTCGKVEWPDIPHIEDWDFTPLIDRALALPGFDRDHWEGTVSVTYARHAIRDMADGIRDRVGNGAIRRIFLIAGCDRTKTGRSCCSRLVETLPEESIIMTLAWGRYRFFNESIGDIAGMPRLLDMGCNDAYSAVCVVQTLLKALDTDVNDLPLSLILFRCGQKSVCLLLALLALGVKDIRLGPILHDLVTPGGLKVLADTFNLKSMDTPEADINTLLG